jgi:hypothetical protein
MQDFDADSNVCLYFVFIDKRPHFESIMFTKSAVANQHACTLDLYRSLAQVKPMWGQMTIRLGQEQ